MQNKVVFLTLSAVFFLNFLALSVYAENTEMKGIQIESATYGGNCGVAKGNVTGHIAKQCNGKSDCRYTVDYEIIGDPAYGCAKTYTVTYRCGKNSQLFKKSLSAEAGWGDKSVVLECSSGLKVKTPKFEGKSGIQIESATYGGNCGAAKGNVTGHIAKQCSGKSECRYTVDHEIIGDPAYGCAKTYIVRYRCGNSRQLFKKNLAAEAGWGDKSVVLKCN